MFELSSKELEGRDQACFVQYSVPSTQAVTVEKNVDE